MWYGKVAVRERRAVRREGVREREKSGRGEGVRERGLKGMRVKERENEWVCW